MHLKSIIFPMTYLRFKVRILLFYSAKYLSVFFQFIYPWNEISSKSNLQKYI